MTCIRTKPGQEHVHTIGEKNQILGTVNLSTQALPMPAARFALGTMTLARYCQPSGVQVSDIVVLANISCERKCSEPDVAEQCLS